MWRELPYLGVEFKRVSAHETVIWALGGDHQVYVYVYGSSVPIRVCEEAYENQVIDKALFIYFFFPCGSMHDSFSVSVKSIFLKVSLFVCLFIHSFDLFIHLFILSLIYP